MKTKREMTLEQALDRIGSATQEIKARGTAQVEGQQFTLEDPVTLEIEAEAGEGEAELEFEIKFTPSEMLVAREELKPRRRRGGLLMGLLAGAALAAGYFLYRRRNRDDWDEDREDVGP